MATKIGSLFGDVSLRTAKLEKGVRDVRKRLDTLGKNMRRTGRTLSTFVTAPIVALGAKAVQSFGQQEQAEAGLRAALQASGQEVQRNFQALTRMASEIQRVTVVGDEAIIRLQQMGLSMGLTATQAGRAARGAIGLSEATGMNLDIALRGVTNALQGQFTTLQRYLPELRTVETDAEKLAIVQEAMAEGFELAKARADTFTGGLKQLGNQIGDIMEEFGEALAPLLEVVRDRIQALADRVQNLTDDQKQMIVTIAAVAAAIGPAVLALGTLATGLSSVLGLLSGTGGLIRMFGALATPLAALFGPVGWVVVGAGVVATLTAAFADLEQLKPALDGLWQSTKSAFQAITNLGRSLWGVLQDLAAMFNIDLPNAVNFFTSAAMQGLRMLKDFLDSVTRVAQNLSIILSRNQSIDTSGAPRRGFFQNTLDVVTLGGFRADGGPVSAGQAYMVGEEGPELFVPRASGEIMPNGSAAAGSPTYNISIAPGTDMGVVAALRNMRTEIGEIAVEAVRDDRMRTVY